jgi:hypothetical protein
VPKLSIEALNWALSHMQRDDVDSTTAFVLMILANRADPDGICWPSVKYICDRTKFADSTVRAACRRIRDMGLLNIEEQARSDGGKGTNRYKLCISLTPPPAAGGTPPPAIGGGPHRQSAGVPPAAGDKTKEETPLPDGKGPRARNPKKTPLPDGFGLSEEVRLWTAEHNLTPTYVAEQLDAFRDDARSNRRMHVDWDAALRSWFRKQPQFDRNAQRPMKGSKSEGGGADRRCVWPRRDALDRCTATVDQDAEGSWIGRGMWVCSGHVKDHLERAERRPRGSGEVRP